MAYTAIVLNVMIASPSGLEEERSIVREILQEWNQVQSRSRQCVLMPLGWDTHTSPELGQRPQQLINDRILKHADILVGIFWTRIGTATGRAASGTVEEIEEHIKSGKPAMLYFSETPAHPDSVDPDQYAQLKIFKKWAMENGLIETYDGSREFREKFRRQLDIKLVENPYIVDIFSSQTARQVVAEPSTAGLSNEAKELLVAANRDPGGNIIVRRFQGGQSIQSNGLQFGNMERRDFARYEAALEELEALGLVKWRSEAVREITASGYTLADDLAKKV